MNEKSPYNHQIPKGETADEHFEGVISDVKSRLTPFRIATGGQLVSSPMTLGQVATHFHLQLWQVRALYERGILPPAQRLGRFRIVDAAELPKLEQALRSAGYLRRTEAQACNA